MNRLTYEKIYHRETVKTKGVGCYIKNKIYKYKNNGEITLKCI